MRVVLSLVAVAGLLVVGFWIARDPEPTVSANETAKTPTAYDPVAAGEETPEGYRPLFPRDAIEPLYEPRFVTAAESDWIDGTLVIGVELDGMAKAYPVAFLNWREMVNDWIGETPILVTW